ncbi:hypothetical protein ACI2KV_24925 [Micromonospora chokoriensis]
MPKARPEDDTTPALHIRADLGAKPRLDEVVQYLDDINTVWLFASQLALLAQPGAAGERARLLLRELEDEWRQGQDGWSSSIEQAVDPFLGVESSTVFIEHEPELDPDPGSAHARYRAHLENTTPWPRVQRLGLASPLEAVLATVAADVKPVGYLVAALVGVERIFRMVIDWQKHRADLAERRTSTASAELVRVAGSGVVSANEDWSAHGMAGVGVVQRAAWETVPDATILDDLGAQYALTRIARADLIEVRLYLPRPMDAQRPSE